MNQCQFDISWVGRCKKDVEENSDYCSEHKDVKCQNCGKQATHDCEDTILGFVCGRLLCGTCRCGWGY